MYVVQTIGVYLSFCSAHEATGSERKENSSEGMLVNNPRIFYYPHPHDFVRLLQQFALTRHFIRLCVRGTVRPPPLAEANGLKKFTLENFHPSW